ncbi:hypothetical protein BV25DRAFT_1922290 [Artomyces pyxidatus]|uniref:Uncharacterized protein n=1 Tax=Artomyces pyxidatus TaxID=48021 RepID=A0ACB8SG49_9AGAM|nr:hypothetical protein BV25DRAFT_1922290 [Artomyces pyxidatus]
MSQPSVPSSKETYYARHRDARQAYQWDYNTIKRVGRRKVSSRERGIREGTRRRLQVGHTQTYVNTFAHRSRNPDRERTDSMVQAEKELRRRCELVEEEEREKHDEEADPDGWVPAYVDILDVWIGQYLEEASELLSTIPQNARRTDPQLHALRRCIATLLQQQELWPQGMKAYGAASEDKVLIWADRLPLAASTV